MTFGGFQEDRAATTQEKTPAAPDAIDVRAVFLKLRRRDRTPLGAMMIRQGLFTAMVLLSAPAYAQDGGFGLTMGQSIATLNVTRKIGSNSFVVAVPKPNSEFTSYLVTATPQDGVCKVSGIGRDHENDSFGSDGRETFLRYKQLLTDRYGKSSDFDFLRAGAIWSASREYAMSLKAKERTLASYWLTSSGASLPPSIGGIKVELKSVDGTATYVAVTYEFANFDSCKAHITSADAAGL